MRAFSSGRGVGAALLVLTLSVSPVFGQQISADAKEHFAAGVALLKDPDGARYQDAYLQFRLAYDKSGKSWKVLGNLGLCALKLERDGEALEYYGRYLKEGGKDLDAGERAQIESDVRVLKSGLAKVTLKSDVSGGVQVTDSRIRQNGANINAFPLDGGVLVLGVRAGHHAMTAKSGGKELTWEADIPPGQAVEHTFVFADLAVAPPAPSASAPPVTTSAPPPPVASEPPPPASQSPLRTAGFIGAGVGGAMIVGGVITGLMAKSKESSVKDSCAPASGGRTLCPQSKHSDLDSAQSLATITNVLFVGGALLAAGGVTLVLVTPKADSPTAARAFAPSIALSPSTLPFGGGLVAHGSFL